MSGIIYSWDIVLTDQKLFRLPVNVILWLHPQRRRQPSSLHPSQNDHEVLFNLKPFNEK